MLGISKTISRGHIEKKIMTDIQDSKAAQSWMESICGPHYLRVSNPKLLHFQHIGSVLSSSTTTIGHIKYSTDVTTEIDDLQNSYSISLPLSGFQELEDRNHRVLSNTYNGIIISPETSCALHISGNCQKTLIRISRQSLESALENLIHKPLIAPLVFDPHIDTTQDSLSAWWRTVRYIEQELSSPNALYNNPLFVYEM